LENNSGYASAFQQKDWNKVAGGVVRVDIRADESGCDLVWDSPLRSPSVVAKLAAGSGIAWYYSFDQVKAANGQPVNQWSFVGLDFKTGKQVARIPTGLGRSYDNNWSSMSIAPDGTLYVGVTSGLVQVRGKQGPGGP
ncbi:MAG: hypothetical protein KGM49_14050, partial [Sphingomonadales bacterium]|nr:hypothetical protein [Sphingomonadales bacterium]